MSSRYPVEALLRPPIELWSSAVMYSVGVILLIAPGAFLMTSAVATVGSIPLFFFGTLRVRQGLAITRYHRGLTRLPRYSMTSDRVPVSNRLLFLGKGFTWEQIHVQRLRDLRRRNAARYLTPGRFFRVARYIETYWEHRRALSLIVRLVSCDAWWNPVRPLPAVGGRPQLHAVGMPEGERDIYMPLDERVGHTLVLGTTRVGKTRLAEILITQDIHRGDVTIVLDPKGDADLMMRTYTEAKKAGRPVYVFHLGYPDISARYNPIGDFGRITEIATRIADQLPNEGNSAAFKEFGWRFANIVSQALVALGRRPDYPQIRRYINDIEPLYLEYARQYLAKHGPDGWKDTVSTMASAINDNKLPPAMRGRNHEGIAIMNYMQDRDLYDPVLDGLVSAWKYDRTYFDKIVSSLAPLLEKLTTGKAAELISPSFDATDTRPVFDWMSAIRQGAVVYVGLDALSDPLVASAVGSSMFADLASVAGRIYKHGANQGLPEVSGADKPFKVSIHADEFNELVADQFIPLVNKAGGAGFQVTAYTQTADDIEAGIGSRPKAGQIAGNFNTLIMMRVKTPETAAFLTDLVPDVEVDMLMGVSGASDSDKPSEFSTANQDRLSSVDVPMLVPADVTQLPKGQAFALLEGGRLYKLRLPRPEADDDLPENLVAMAREMRASYSTADDWYQDNQWWGSHSHESTPEVTKAS